MGELRPVCFGEVPFGIRHSQLYYLATAVTPKLSTDLSHPHDALASRGISAAAMQKQANCIKANEDAGYLRRVR